MLLTDAQLQEIRQIIADHHSAFIANTISPNAVSPDTLRRLKDKGLFQSHNTLSVADAYLYGHVLAALDDPKTQRMSYAEFKRYVAANPVPLSGPEKQAVKMAQEQAAQYCRGLGNRVDTQTGRLLIDADAELRRQMRDKIQTEVARNIEARESVKQLKSALGHATQDWTRDLDRIAVTEKQDAMEHGVADCYAKETGSDTDVFKRPAPSCCGDCARLYLGSDGNPKIFKLSELEASGTNVGKPRSDWLPVIGPTHPLCECKMSRVPTGFVFNAKGVLVPASMLERSMLNKASCDERITFMGLPIVVEHRAGTWRALDSGRSVFMEYSYGYIAGTHGNDGEAMDCFLGPDANAPFAYFVHQLRPAGDFYDEDKVMLGFASVADAAAAYLAQYKDARMFGGISPVTIDQVMALVNVGTHGVAKARGPALTVELTPRDNGLSSKLSKASGGQRISPTVAAEGSLTGRRQIRQRGADGVNFVVASPVRAGKNQKPNLDENAPLSARRLVIDTKVSPATSPETVKQRYDPGPRVPVVEHEIEYPENYKRDPDVTEQTAQATKQAVLTHYENVKLAPNTMPSPTKKKRTPVKGRRQPVS